MKQELERARAERDAAFTAFEKATRLHTKHSLKAKAARHKYMLARAEVRALEFDYLTNPIVV